MVLICSMVIVSHCLPQQVQSVPIRFIHLTERKVSDLKETAKSGICVRDRNVNIRGNYFNQLYVSKLADSQSQILRTVWSPF